MTNFYFNHYIIGENGERQAEYLAAKMLTKMRE